MLLVDLGKLIFSYCSRVDCAKPILGPFRCWDWDIFPGHWYGVSSRRTPVRGRRHCFCCIMLSESDFAEERRVDAVDGAVVLTELLSESQHKSLVVVLLSLL